MEGIPTVNVTSRRRTEIEALDALMFTIGYAYIKYGLVPVDRNGRAYIAIDQRGKTSSPATSSPASTPAKAGSGSTPAKAGSDPNASPQGSNPAQYDTNEIHEFRIAKIEVKPAKDDKIGLNFYVGSHQYPDIWGSFTLDKAIEFMKGSGYEWKEEHFTGVREYKDLDFIVTWKYSEKRNSKGNQYKNLEGTKAIG
jgi:hypothetical protein